MGTTAQKLAKLAQTKTEIRAAIIAKEVQVPENATFASYSEYIGQISGGIVPTGNIELQQQTGTDVTNYATASVKSGSATTPATTKQQSTPNISVNSSGLITASVAATSVSVTPTVSAGWVSSGTAGTITMSASSATSQLSTQGATTITPSESSQTAVAAGKYTTGAITVGAISSTYVGTGVTRQAAKTVTPTTSAQTAVAANIYTTGAVTVAAIQTETKTALANGTVTPTSGKYLSSVDVSVPIPAGCKWYGYRSWTSSNLASNMFLKTERWTNNEGTTGIVIGDIIALEATITDKSNRIVYLLIKVTGMDGTTAIGDSIGVVEKYQEASPTITANTVYRTGTGTPSATLGNDGDLYLDLNS